VAKVLKAKSRLLVEAMAAGNDSGLGRHVRLLLRFMPDLGDDWDVLVLWPAHARERPPLGVQIKRVKPIFARLWIHWTLPLWVRRWRADVVLHLGYTLPVRAGSARRILLVPDMGPLEKTSTRMSRHAVANARAMHRQIPLAARIWVSTEFTSRRLQAILGIPNGKIDQLPPFDGYARAWRAEPAISAAIREKYPLGFFLTVGNIEPRKNHIAILNAMAWLRERHVDFPPLILAGHQAWDNGVTRSATADLGLTDNVVFTGHIEDAALAGYWQGALGFITASLYEGFGMPLFEALTLGKAAIYQAGTAHDDFAHGAALALETRDRDALGQAMEKLWLDEEWRKGWEEKARSRGNALLQSDLGSRMRSALERLLPSQSES